MPNQNDDQKHRNKEWTAAREKSRQETRPAREKSGASEKEIIREAAGKTGSTLADQKSEKRRTAALKKAEQETEADRKKKESEKALNNPFFGYRKRRFPIWQRLIALISLCALALVGGAMFGYGVLGDGSPWAVFDWDTWRHILDFLKVE
ncbi:DNA-directed RNA polymerase subunit beta [Sporolactobacillus sp. THM7-7]|nr:DNA-directed RNA polymerase subunit beta [Sporolactobacillus sp. THM7-7]